MKYLNVIRGLCLFVMVFLSLAETQIAHAQTDIPSSDVSGTWTLTNSPYHINGEITIPNGETLTIEPGVEVIFTGHYKFNIQGRILAAGTEQDSIIFTANDHSTGWHGLRFDNTPSSNDSSIIEYCRLEYGKANTGSGNVNRCGGAIYIKCDQLRISHCLLQHNMCYHPDIQQTGGGAIIIAGGNPIISHCEFKGNTSSFFGGALLIWFGSSKGQIVNNYIHHSTGHGTITIGEGASPILYNNLIVNNHSTGHGVIHISNPGGMSVFINNTIVNNTCAGAGGAVFVNHGMTPLFVNNIIYGNSPAQVRLEAPSGLDFINCLIEGGEEAFSGASFTGIYQNNFDNDPMFVDAANDDYHLSNTSPCISAGSDSIKVGNKWYYEPDCDNEGNPRPNPPGTSPDIGAFESKLGGPYIKYLSHVLDDSDGNNNEKADAGETAKLIVTLKNTSLLDATGVSATLTNDDPDVQIIQANANFGDLARDQSSSNQNAPFTFSVSPSSVTHLSTFYLNITTVEGGYAYVVGFKILIGSPAILLVDDDEGKKYEAHYTKALEMKQIYSEAWDVSLNGAPTIDVLQQYESVIWFTGDDRDNTLTAEEQSVIAAFLDGGGKLLISGQDIGYDLVKDGSTTDSTFYSNYLHAQYIADSSNATITRGVGGDPITGSPSRMVLYFTSSYGGAQNQTAPDIISPIPPAETILEYGPPYTTGAALKYENTATGSRLVYLAFGFEGIAGPAEDSAAELMEAILKWLSGQQTRVEENLMEFVPKAYALSQNYPNPFNPQTRIKYELPHAGKVVLKVYNIVGQEIRTLADEIKPAGSFEVVWDARDNTGHRVASGVYLSRLVVQGFVQTRKMLLLE
jgi:hypothetical protein